MKYLPAAVGTPASPAPDCTDWSGLRLVQMTTPLELLQMPTEARRLRAAVGGVRTRGDWPLFPLRLAVVVEERVVAAVGERVDARWVQRPSSLRQAPMTT